MIETNSFDFDAAERLVFDRAGPFIDQRQPKLRFLETLRPVKRAIEYIVTQPERLEEHHHIVHAYADLYNRGIIGLDDDTMGMDGGNERLIESINEIEDVAEDFGKTEGIMLSLAFVAFAGVLMRPKDLVLSERDRKLHSSDVRSARGENQLAEIFRHRRNLMYSLASRFAITDRDKKNLRPFVFNGNVVIDHATVNRRLPELDPRIHSRTIDIVSREFISRYSKNMLSLFGTDNNVAEALRSRFIERGFELFRELDAESSTRPDIFYADLPSNQKVHILRGDKNGGGHHIPSLDPAYKRIVSEVVEIPSSIDPDVRMPVAFASKVLDGVVQPPMLDNFFPSEWTAEEVIDAVQSPGRIVFHRENRGRFEQFCHTRGVVIKRVIEIFQDCDDEEILTAYPVSDIPSGLQKRLAA